MRASARWIVLLGAISGSTPLLVASLALGSGTSAHRARTPMPRLAPMRHMARVRRLAPDRAGTVVSLEFDHALSDALPGVELANRHGMKVTLFAMSGRIGEPTYMTVPQLLQLQADGNEIGGHTIDHADLSLLGDSAQRQEICGDRAALAADGFDATDFAYPYGHFNSATPRIARSCGYQSARGAGGLTSQGGCYGPCPAAGTLPPNDLYDTWTLNSVLDSTRLGTIEHYVMRAERDGGGWLQIVFHYVCDRCNLYAVSFTTLARLIPWLAAQRVRVETVHEALTTRFDPASLQVRAGRASVRLTGVAPCSTNPVSAACSPRRGLTLRLLRVRPGAELTALTARGTLAVQLLLRLRGRAPTAIAARRSAGGTRWRFALPATLLRGSARLLVRAPLGLATYRVALGPLKGPPVRR